MGTASTAHKTQSTEAMVEDCQKGIKKLFSLLEEKQKENDVCTRMEVEILKRGMSFGLLGSPEYWNLRTQYKPPTFPAMPTFPAETVPSYLYGPGRHPAQPPTPLEAVRAPKEATTKPLQHIHLLLQTYLLL